MIQWTTWLIAEEVVETTVKEGGLFDFDATLPLMALQFLLLVLLLNAVFYKPVSRVIDERTDYVRSTLDRARETQSKYQRLAQQFDEEIKQARRQSQEIIAAAQAEAQAQAAEKVAQAQREVQQEREKAAQEISAQKREALQSLEQQVDALSRQILDKLLGQALVSR